jgi:hypothetical protein
LRVEITLVRVVASLSTLVRVDITLKFFFRIINDFVHRFILDHTFVDFTVSLLILPFYIVDFNSIMVKSTVKP